MKNLENYGVQALDAKEIRTTNGGGFWDDLLDGTIPPTSDNPITNIGITAYDAGVMIGNAAGMLWDAITD